VADAQLLKIYLDLFQNSFFKKLFAFVPLWFLLIYRLNNIVNQQEKGFFHVIRGKERIHLSFPPQGSGLLRLSRAFSATLTGRFWMGMVKY
jgi:hypothetical protein